MNYKNLKKSWLLLLTSSLIFGCSNKLTTSKEIESFSANLVFNKTTLEFNNNPINLTSSSVLTLTNSGKLDAININPAAFQSASFNFLGTVYPGTGGTCSQTLAAGQSCNIVVQFIPTIIQNYNDELILNYRQLDQTTGQTSTLLTGSGIGLAVLSLDQNIYNLGTVVIGDTSSATITITNIGTANASNLTGSLSSPFYFVGGNYPGTSGTCGNTLSTNSSCTINVEFEPTASGTVSDPFDLNYNNGLNSLTSSATLMGNPELPASVSVSDNPSYGFTSIYNSLTETHVFTYTNSGQAAASSIVISGLSAPFSILSGTCGTTLSGGSTCTETIQFAPVLTGNYSNSLNFSYNNGDINTSTVETITGVSSTDPNALISISNYPTYNFGSVARGGNSTVSFTFTNNGLQTASGGGLSGLASPFNIVGGTCGNTLSAGTSCILDIQFAPSADGAFSNTLVYTYSNGSTSVNYTYSIIGNGIN